MDEILPQIRLNCNNFICLSAAHNYFQGDDAAFLVASLPQLKYLDLHGGFIEKEDVDKILKGCKQLVHLDIRECGFL